MTLFPSSWLEAVATSKPVENQCADDGKTMARFSFAVLCVLLAGLDKQLTVSDKLPTCKPVSFVILLVYITCS